MIQDRLNDKEHDIQGVQKQSSELISIAWQKGYQAGFNDGYDTRREAEIRPQGEWIKQMCSLWSYSFICSNCDANPTSVQTPYCPICGAKMNLRGEEE